MEGVKYMSFNGNKANLSVDARGEGIILMTKQGNFSIKFAEAIQVVRDAGALKDLAKQKGNKKEIKKGNQVVVMNYSYQHDDGMFYLYENVSRNLTLDMTVKYKLMGLKIQG